MPDRIPLSAADRRLLDLANRAAVVNPFGAERRRIERDLADLGPEPRGRDTGRSSGSGATIFDRALDAVEQRLGALGPTIAPDGMDPADARRLRLAHLFVAHHRACDALDAHVAAQLASAGTGPVPFPDGPGILADLEARGFRPDEARRLLSLFFQLRRAYHFIDRTLVGSCPSIGRVRERLWHNVFTHDLSTYVEHLQPRMEDFSTLVLGETGTGKGNAAAAIGRSGYIPFDVGAGRFAESFTRAFVPVNLAEFSRDLLESELFGHRKGAFTGAIESRDGVFARCSPHGSIFLDEIGELGVALQVKLLRVLQDRRFVPVGGSRAARFSGRVIAATNRPPGALLDGGGLRPDLYYRLCSDEIVVPPLRQRLREDPSELRFLVEHLVERIAGTRSRELADRVVRELTAHVPGNHPWPGNVRELEQAVRRVLLEGAYRPRPGQGAGSPPPFIEAIVDGELDARQLLAAYCAHLHGRLGTYEAVARVTGLDRRTARKHVLAHGDGAG